MGIAELEEQARRHSEAGDEQATARVCREILTLDEGHVPSLRFLSDLALNSGDVATSEQYYRRLLQAEPDDARLYPQYGQILYRLGRLDEAVSVYERYWTLNPRNPMVYLALGSLHVELGHLDRAAQIFSLGESVDSRLLNRWRDPDCRPEIREMSRNAWQALCRHHTALHESTIDALDGAEQLTRVRNAIWPMVDDREWSYAHERQRAQVFYIPFVEAPPFFDPARFDWTTALESSYPVIREEILAGLDVEGDGRPYLGDGHRLEGAEWEPLVNKMSWASVHLYSRGVANRKVLDKFPQTLAALESLPLATYRGQPAEVFVSVLAPRTRIPAYLPQFSPRTSPSWCRMAVA